MTTDKRTKAELLEHIQRLNKEVDELESRPVARVAEKIPEAEALAACIRALDVLAGTRRSTGYNFGESRNEEVERVLISLAARHHIPLTRTVQVDCTRAHIADPDELARNITNSIQGAIRQGIIDPDWNRA